MVSFKTHFIREDRCRRCMKCLEFCEQNAIIVPETAPLIIDSKKCNNCGECVAACNLRAIQTKSKFSLK